jgi:hypothetical protein
MFPSIKQAFICLDSFISSHILKHTFSLQAAGYYDMGFQAPTSLATGREGGLASVAYSMSDGRFTRADNNASPVPSTLSQQVGIAVFCTA